MIPAPLVKKSWFRFHNAGCGSGMFIPDPDFYPAWIPDLGPNNINNKRGGEKIVLPFLVATNFTNLKIKVFYF
jgi:hypothetical protein